MKLIIKGMSSITKNNKNQSNESISSDPLKNFTAEQIADKALELMQKDFVDYKMDEWLKEKQVIDFVSVPLIAKKAFWASITGPRAYIFGNTCVVLYS